MDTKTKYFLEKIDSLISKGVVKNHQQVVNELDWNKSVMSSVRKGTVPVPQHIYNKFKQVYENDLTDKQDDVTLLETREELLTLLKEQNQYLKEQNKLLIDKLKAVEKVDSNLKEVAENQLILAAFQQGWQEYWAENLPGADKRPLHVIKEMIRKKASSSLKTFSEAGIHVSYDLGN